MRTQLPQDYKELARLYGNGRFLEFFDIYTPRSPTTEGRLVNAVQMARSDFIYAAQGSHFFDLPPLPIWPRPGGLLACGQTANGDQIFWLTRGLVDEWPIVIWDRSCEEGIRLHTFDCDLTDFLAEVAAGAIESEVFPGRWSPEAGGSAFRSSPP